MKELENISEVVGFSVCFGVKVLVWNVKIIKVFIVVILVSVNVMGICIVSKLMIDVKVMMLIKVLFIRCFFYVYVLVWLYCCCCGLCGCCWLLLVVVEVSKMKFWLEKLFGLVILVGLVDWRKKYCF